LAPESEWLILHAGGGRNKHKLFQGRQVKRINIDLDFTTLVQDSEAKAKALANLEALPLAGGCIDLIVCEMVFEHVRRPEQMIREFYRCLKPNGRIVFITPNAFCYPYLIARITPFWFHRLHGFIIGRKDEDVFPTFYRLNTASAIRRYFAQAGFEMAHLTQIDSSCAYLSVLPVLYLLAVFYSWLINSVKAFSFLRQFHIGCFYKPQQRSVATNRNAKGRKTATKRELQRKRVFN
jgi:SAM-dependent methyltransferase